MPGFNSIDGIQSGLNTSEMVDAIMEFERRPAVLLEVQQVEKQAIISAYQALQAKFLALSSDLASLVSTSTYEQASIGVSDESYLTAARASRVGTGSYDFQVLQLAHNHQIASQGFGDPSINSFGTGEIKIKVGNGAEKSITIDSNNNSLVDIKNAINDANTGVTASIINDGTSSNAYRLVLTSNTSGKANKITFSSSLSGGNNLNVSTSSFDAPETLIQGDNSTSAVSLGASASYTGSKNSSYTFTVAGTGEQTIGTDTITLNWVDDSNPANTGSIVVTQADFEYEVVGAEGMYLSFSSGVLTAGDSFKIDTFAPLLQEGTDAKIAVGSGGGSGSPITISSSTNSFTDVVGGLNLTVKKVTPAGESVSVNTDVDVNAIKQKITSFIENYNKLNEYIDKQNTYNTDTKEAPVLFGDYTIWRVQNSLRSRMASTISGIDSKFNQLYSIGIRTDVKGKLAIKNNATLESAIKNNLDDVIKLFTSTGNSSHTGIEFVSATEKTKAGTSFDVNITQAATHGKFEGGSITDPVTTPIVINSTNNKLKFKIDGRVSEEISLVAGNYNSYEDLVEEIQAQILADPNIGSKGVTVSWVDNENGTGYLKLESSTFGATSKVELETAITNSAFSILGLSSGSGTTGLNVEGTINGEQAEGSGLMLRGKEGNATTEGLAIKVTMDEASVVEGVEGTITYVQGLAAKLNYSLGNITKTSTGIIDSRIKLYDKQIESISKQITDIDKRLALRRESLYKKFYEMEVALGEMNVQSQFLQQQLAGINLNWKAAQNSN